MRVPPEDDRRGVTLDELIALHDASSAQRYDTAHRLVDDGKLHAPVKLLVEEYGGREVRAATVLAHTVSHAAYHRAQLHVMLRQRGRPIAGDLDPVEWELAGGR